MGRVNKQSIHMYAVHCFILMFAHKLKYGISACYLKGKKTLKARRIFFLLRCGTSWPFHFGLWNRMFVSNRGILHTNRKSRQMSEYCERNYLWFSASVKRENVMVHDCAFLFPCEAHLPGSSLSPFIHLMVAAGLLLMAVQVISVSLPSLKTSSRASMMGLPGGTTRGHTNQTL